MDTDLEMVNRSHLACPSPHKIRTIWSLLLIEVISFAHVVPPSAAFSSFSFLAAESRDKIIRLLVFVASPTSCVAGTVLAEADARREDTAGLVV